MIWVRRLFLLLLVAFLLADVARFYSPHTGFTSLLNIGDKLGASRGLAGVPHHVYADSWGYDGQAYAQLALNPTLSDPSLREAVDSLGYRARRMGAPWLAWLGGLGQPAWVLQAYALINVVAWLLLGWALLHWLPPADSENLVRWFLLMFGVGVLNSVRGALTDLPAFTILVLGLRSWERGRRGLASCHWALALLCRDTLALNIVPAGLSWPVSSGAGLMRDVGRLVLCFLPFVAWLVAIPLLAGVSPLEGGGNFTWPFVGYVERWRELISAAQAPGGLVRPSLHALLGHIALSVQCICLLIWRRPADGVWRMALGSCLLLVFISTPVWEGFPGAAARVLLPMTFAFTVLLPRGRWWSWPLLLAGSLGVFAGMRALEIAPGELVVTRGPAAHVSRLSVVRGAGWQDPEQGRLETWAWAAGTAHLKVRNASSSSVRIRFRGRVSTAWPQQISVTAEGGATWAMGPVSGKQVKFASAAFVVRPGEQLFTFSTDEPAQPGTAGHPVGRAYSVRDLVLEVQPESGAVGDTP